MSSAPFRLSDQNFACSSQLFIFMLHQMLNVAFGEDIHLLLLQFQGVFHSRSSEEHLMGWPSLSVCPSICSHQSTPTATTRCCATNGYHSWNSLLGNNERNCTETMRFKGCHCCATMRPRFRLEQNDPRILLEDSVA
jgi:hypothetical protein